MSVVYTLYDALVSINVPDDKAKAVIDAMEREMMDKLATKADIQLLHQEMSAMGNLLSKDIQIQMAALQNTLTVRLGIMMAAMFTAATALVTAARYFS